jgi:hypothetical protein
MFSPLESVLEADFLNNYILIKEAGSFGSDQKIRMDPVLKDGFLANVVDPFWNGSKDKLDYFSFYGDGSHFCQRRKEKTDFNNGTKYWATYEFIHGTNEQGATLKNQILEFYNALREVKEIKIDLEIKQIDENVIFFEQRYLKKKREKNEMLSGSDWRVLPDVADSYPGEKDMWIQWRAHLRDFVLLEPETFPSMLEFFKYTYEIKFPIDPKNYRKIYPDGLTTEGTTAPAYMDENDPNQWGQYDIDVSSDFMEARLQSIYNLASSYDTGYRKISENLMNIMKLIGVEDVVPVDWSRYYTNDSELEGA